MRIDFEQFFEDDGLSMDKTFNLCRVTDKISAYVGTQKQSQLLFEHDTLEKVGVVYEVDRNLYQKFYTAKFCYGWDGNPETKDQFVKVLCRRTDRLTAHAMIIDEYLKVKNA